MTSSKGMRTRITPRTNTPTQHERSIMRHYLTFSLALLIAGSAFPQTRLIAHKSHSGSPASYCSGASRGHFGLPPQMERRMPPRPQDTVVAKPRRAPVDTIRVGKDTVHTTPVLHEPELPVDTLRATPQQGSGHRSKQLEVNGSSVVATRSVTAPVPGDDRTNEPRMEKEVQEVRSEEAGVWWVGAALMLGTLLASWLYRWTCRRA
jgi:hypothetical protein